ncbi:MAG: hypothetical protein AAGI54_04825 [Planctomycetota bacterium]
MGGQGEQGPGEEEKREAKRRSSGVWKIDPALVAFALELQDHWQEAVAVKPWLLNGAASGKHNVRRGVSRADGAGDRVEVPRTGVIKLIDGKLAA